MIRRTVLALALALASSSALAAPSPAARGLITGGVSLGGELVGAVGLGFAGLGLGAAACRPDAFECWGPLIGAGMGATTGVVVGGPLGGALGAKISDARPGRAALFSLGGLGLGAAMLLTGLATESGGLQTVGLVTATVGTPVMAGVGAATDRHLPEAGGPRVAFAPTLAKDSLGLKVTVAGF